MKTNFPILANNPSLVYLDTGASALKPGVVIEKMREYYEEYGVNVHRGMYPLSDRATVEYEAAREKIARFLNAEREEIVFTSGTTHGLNMLAEILCRDLKTGDGIVLTRMEHHANLIPWQEQAKKRGLILKFIELTDDITLDMESARQVIDEKTKIVSFTAISNVLGTVTPAKELVALAHAVGAYAVIDAAQGIVHKKTDVKDLDCDFLVFSGHKLYGPTGIGVVYGKKEHLERLNPFFFGGDMIKYVTYECAEWADVPNKFEAGTPSIAAAIGLGAAVDFVESTGWEKIQNHETEVSQYLFSQLSAVEGLAIIGPKDPAFRSGVCSFVMNGIHPHDIGDLLGQQNIAVRVGHHCAMPLIQMLGLTGTVRASLGIYNTKEDVDRLAEAIDRVKQIFHIS